MGLKERIDADIKAAMLARERDKLNALRAIKSAILLELTKGGSSEELDEAVGMKILQKLHKQRLESAAIYIEQDRKDLAAEEEVQAKVIEAYLPQQMSQEEVADVVREVIASTGAKSMADMGRVMGETNKRLAGKADGSAIAALVKELLSGG
ncbi:MAG: GatB/YqeY domain-containing protein [Flavobacteriales bacterium]|nr:GatB/YqeY domain-containing protein [Flavobacteriales bacterium]MBK6943808.1 GatB/YqeY domain-containing protein [Flavobacteriales bacterium]MBK7240018.1 GatB/YqeY domain-containing protein [Flavobacteriales bacterium]MBK7297067.1 GatB/YqeY domain-containing protein [Flavobacteriales bacterium]MBK9535660.1 GatB/YqeY domain-containing protein [Flavobacteriales bacterium]